MTAIWLVPTYRAHTWIYRQSPQVGDHVRYMDDGFDSSIQEVRATYILFTDGTVMRKRLDWNMIWAWIGRHDYMRNVLSWRDARKRRETWVHAGTVLYNG